MRTGLSALVLALAVAVPAYAHGLLIPEDKNLPPLAMVNHRVTITIDDQVAVTTVEQSFRNHTDRQLEATYLFPIPKGASVDKFTMWVGGRRMGAETLGASQARGIYEGIVRRLEDPALLEYLGRDLCKVRIYPIPRRGEQRGREI